MSDDARTGARIAVGGNRGRFEPILYSEKWSDESWFTLTYPELQSSARPQFGGGLAQWQNDSRQHNWYITDAGDLEYEVVLLSKPLSPVFEFHIDFPKGLAFEYQPPLTEDRDPRITFATPTTAWADTKILRSRPEHIVGSYALYWSKSNNQYQTGKVGHIHRPRFHDALGRTAWGDLSIDPIRKRLKIVGPEKWLARAAYPVILDPTIGYTSLGATSDDTDGYSLSQLHTASASGDANPGTAFYGCSTDSGTASVYVALYNGTGDILTNARVGSASSAITATTTAAFRSAAITVTGIVNGTSYYVASWSATTGVNSRYDAGSGTGYFCNTDGVATPSATYPDGAGGNGAFNNRLSAYVDYTASGGRASKNTRAAPLGMEIGMGWRMSL